MLEQIRQGGNMETHQYYIKQLFEDECEEVAPIFREDDLKLIDG